MAMNERWWLKVVYGSHAADAYYTIDCSIRENTFESFRKVSSTVNYRLNLIFRIFQCQNGYNTRALKQIAMPIASYETYEL